MSERMRPVLYSLLALFTFLLVCLIYVPTLHAEEVSYSCSVSQGFNFEKNAQVHVGHLVSLTIGNDELMADLRVTLPTDISSTIEVVGVLSDIHWDGGYGDPIQLTAQVSTDNKNDLNTLIHQTIRDTTVVFEFVVYEYDPRERQYFPAFHCDESVLSGMILKEGGELAISIESDESMEVVSPKNFTFFLGVMPPDGMEQELHRATGVGRNYVEAWGVSRGR